MEGVALILWNLDTTPFIGRKRLRWGTVETEATDPLPGDGLVPEPKWSNTLGITIDASPDDVWPWIAQLGQGRGGFYTYQTLENMVGCRITNTTSILPEHQHPVVGEGIHLYADAPPLNVEIVDPPYTLVLFGSPADTGGDTWGRSTWQFAINPGSGSSSRLLVRGRYEFGSDWKSRWGIRTLPTGGDHLRDEPQDDARDQEAGRARHLAVIAGDVVSADLVPGTPESCRSAPCPGFRVVEGEIAPPQRPA